MTYSFFDASDDQSALDGFDGTTRLFPLPNVVLFPGVLLPLHIFEPRYRQLVADAMDSDRLMTMVLLKPGYESDYEGRPPIFEIGCIGQIVHFEQLDDGRSNLILRGLRRVRIENEEDFDADPERSYRTAQVALLDESPVSDEAEQTSVQRVLETMTEILVHVGRGSDADKLAAAAPVAASQLCDLACHCLGFDVSVKQSLLCELDVTRRADTLLVWMQALLQTIRRQQKPLGGPPEFSNN